MSQSKQTPRVFLIGNISKPKVPDCFKRLSDWLKRRGVLVGADLNGRAEAILKSNPDLIIVLGGDGTLLQVGQALQRRQIPIVGVNMGKLGYLADFDADELENDLDRILTDPELVSRRMMFDVAVDTPSGPQSHSVALNDCVIRVGQPFRTIGLSVQIDGHTVTDIRGDGLIVATPTGSTAHNMSCGGPLLQPDVEAIILTPKCPHSLSHCPVVVGPDADVRITVSQDSDGAAVVIDGQSVQCVPGGTCVSVRKSTACFQLIRNPRRQSWDTLTEKLKWGQPLGVAGAARQGGRSG